MTTEDERTNNDPHRNQGGQTDSSELAADSLGELITGESRRLDPPLSDLLDHEAQQLSDELAVDEEAARGAIIEAAADYLETAKVRQFVPVLAHRRAHERLSTESHADAGRGQGATGS